MPDACLWLAPWAMTTRGFLYELRDIFFASSQLTDLFHVMIHCIRFEPQSDFHQCGIFTSVD